MPGLIQDVLPLIGPGQDAAIAKIGGETVIVRVGHRWGALQELSPTGQTVGTVQQVRTRRSVPPPTRPTRTGALNLFESASVGDGARNGHALTWSSTSCRSAQAADLAARRAELTTTT